MEISNTIKEKASLPRECRNATDLRESLRHYVARRLLAIADSCLMCDEGDLYRKEYGLIHRRYANILNLITEAVQDVEYITKSLITWMHEDYQNALTGAQKDAAGLCAVEILMIVEKFEQADLISDEPTGIRGSDLAARSPTYREAMQRRKKYKMGTED